MQLTIEQALERAIAAHKEGKLQEAEKLYRAKLNVQSKHPDPNHKLGVLRFIIFDIRMNLCFL